MEQLEEDTEEGIGDERMAVGAEKPMVALGIVGDGALQDVVWLAAQFAELEDGQEVE